MHKNSDDTLKVTGESSKDSYELSLSNVIRDLVLKNINWQEKRNKNGRKIKQLNPEKETEEKVICKERF